MLSEPKYLRLAGLLRVEISNGRLGPGERLPSETQLMMRHQVTRSVAKWAINVLKADGLVEGRQGQGVFVKSCRRTPRHLLLLSASAQPDLTETIKADQLIAERLALPLGEFVMHTCSRPIAADGALHIVETWRPQTPPSPQVADTTQERVIVRPASPAEIADLELPSRGSVIVISQRRLAATIPVVTADFIAPSDQVELIYEFREAY